MSLVKSRMLYGLGLDVPLGAHRATHLIAGLGHIRFDAEGGPVANVSVGLTRQFGGTNERPTFSRQRSVLTGLLGY